MAAFKGDWPVVDPSAGLLDRALRSLPSLRSLARCARLTVMKNRSWRILEAFSLAALAEGVLFFLWRRVVSSGFGEAPENL